MLPAFADPSGGMPAVNDPDFVVKRYVAGIPNSPTTMAFVGDGDILVLQKTDGQVRLIRDGVLQARPMLDANVANTGEQGMLGIASVGSQVYLYFSESNADGQSALGRRVYRYDWTGSALQNPVLVRDMNLTQFYHNGGGMAVAPDGTVYVVVGDAGRYGQLQNWGSEFYPDTSSIIPVAPTGPYYAIGVRNSFGLAFDPYTGRMWDTENGNDTFDEINMVEPYSNSGWYAVMGPVNQTQLAKVGYKNYTYSDPEFAWEQPVAPTGLAFVEPGPLGKFAGSLFVGDCNNGNLYRFRLNDSRDGLALDGPLSDGIAGTGESQEGIIFGTGFGCISDVETGPDGLLYLVSLSEGTIFRVEPRNYTAQAPPDTMMMAAAAYPAVAAGGVAAAAIAYAVVLLRRRRMM
jgi:glucose/arabinose dehydrogenase